MIPYAGSDKKPGRPPKPASERMSRDICVRLTEDDKNWLNNQATALGVKPASLVRMILRNHRANAGH